MTVDLPFLSALYIRLRRDGARFMDNIALIHLLKLPFTYKIQ